MVLPCLGHHVHLTGWMPSSAGQGCWLIHIHTVGLNPGPGTQYSVSKWLGYERIGGAVWADFPLSSLRTSWKGFLSLMCVDSGLSQGPMCWEQNLDRRQWTKNFSHRQNQHPTGKHWPGTKNLGPRSESTCGSGKCLWDGNREANSHLQKGGWQSWAGWWPGCKNRGVALSPTPSLLSSYLPDFLEGSQFLKGNFYLLKDFWRPKSLT